MKKLEILQVVPSLKPTGPVRVALDLAKGFKAAGHSVHFYYFDELEGAVEVEQSRRIGFREKLDLRGFDIVHTHAMRPDLWGRLNRKNITSPLVTTLHNYVKDDLKWYYNAAISAVFSKVWNYAQAKHDACVCLSKDMQNYYASFWKNKHLKVIPNTRIIEQLAPNSEEAQLITDFARGRRIIMNLSEPSNRKGLDQIVRALALDDQWVFVHYGSGPESENLKQLAKSLQVDDRILWRGYNRYAASSLPLADVMALPSHAEGFPLVLLEAVAQGIAAVISDIPAMRDLFPEGAVATFELNDSQDLMRTLNSVYPHKEVRASLAKHTFDELYSPAMVTDLYLALYNQLKNG